MNAFKMKILESVSRYLELHCQLARPLRSRYILILLVFPFLALAFNQDQNDEIPHQEVENWAQGIGTHTFTLLNIAARYQAIDKNFKGQGATTAKKDGIKLVKEMARDISNVMKYKVQAVKRIMNVAEEVSQDASYLDEEWRGYYNSKLINDQEEKIESLEERYDPRFVEYYGSQFKTKYSTLPLVSNSHFYDRAISLNASTVHVPTNVFEGGPDVRKAIRWSEALEKTFYSNYEHDHRLSWQYFGSATGFLRQFPGSSWNDENQDPDLYDARLRPWFIQAANTPKDMVILLDISGSMTGLRKEIAKHVVMNILDTLNENDFFNVFTFNENASCLVPCLSDTLVQANLENIGYFKSKLDDLQTENIANFTAALNKAFERLKQHNDQGYGSQCNQAIMLITDGAPDTFEEIFKENNWPQKMIRLFTYLIGREVTETKSLVWMACANKGYFVQVTTPSEVREQVLKYIPVVARPMVMYQDRHPVVWTGVYADVADPRQTAWLWERKERLKQRERTINYRELKDKEARRHYGSGVSHIGNRTREWFEREINNYLKYRQFNLSDAEIARRKAVQERSIKESRSDPDSPHGYTLMTTVSVPVFNRSTKVKRVADLLGVAGTDVPIKEIKKLAPPYQLGVNGYAFMVNMNGHILFHPDLRPTFIDILKPNYNSVDLTEVELPDANDLPRMNHTDLYTLRREMIEQRDTETNFRVRIHLDDMKRVVIRGQRYYTAKVEDTPFSLGIAMPQDYGQSKVVGQIELSLEMKKSNINFNASDYFRHGEWSLHPDWVYCEYKYDQGDKKTQEELLLHFLTRAQMPGWKWRSTRTRPPPDSSNNASRSSTHDDDNDYYCDKTLIQSLIFDAKATDVYSDMRKLEHVGKGHFEDSGIASTFVATRSGLSRWLDLRNSTARDPNSPVMGRHKKAIDEVWYRRAVDFYNEDPEAYVFSVPFHAGTLEPHEVMITATRAIYVSRNEYRYAPAAVVGVNIRLDSFTSFFKNKTYSCHNLYGVKSTCKPSHTCESELLDCYLLDDNGFVVASEKFSHTGKFFGAIEGTIMDSLIQSEVYNKIKIFDYQGVCLDVISDGNVASIILNPIQSLKCLFNWILGNIVWLLVKTELYQLWDPNLAWAHNQEMGGEAPMFNDFENSHYDERAQDTHIERDTNGESEDNLLLEYMLINSSLSEDVNPIYEYGDSYDARAAPDYAYDASYEQEGDLSVKLKMAFINKTRPHPCDKSLFLYKVNSSKLKEAGSYKPVKGKLSNCHQIGCGKPFSLQKVKHTNLILIVVHNHCPCEAKNVDIQPTEIVHDNETDCELMGNQNFRKRQGECFNYHPDETSIEECGGCSPVGIASLRTLMCIVIAQIFYTNGMKT